MMAKEHVEKLRPVKLIKRWRESYHYQDQSTAQEPRTNSLSKSSPCQQVEVRSEAVDGPLRQNNTWKFNTLKVPEPAASKLQACLI